MGKNKIYEKDPFYDFLRPWADWAIKYSYRKVQVKGEDNLPKDGALLFAPNHCNTLMDALVMLRAYPKETVFGARADMFNNPFIARIMFFLRILPMVRQRDGLRNVLKNHETQETIVETLENGVRFCMYPEGTHRPKHSLQALGKGVFRAALAANAKFGNERPVYIIPTGIEYGDYFRYRSTSLVTYGKPLNVTEFVKDSSLENEAQVIDALRKELSQRMSGLITYIKPDADYEAEWTLTKMLSVYDRKKCYGEFGTDLYESMLDNRRLVSEIEKKCSESPEEMQDILERVKTFEKKRKAKGISIYSFKKKEPLLSICLKGLTALLGLPYFIFSATGALPMWATAAFIRKSVRDKAFRNTVSFGVKLGLTTILFPILAVLAFCLAPWWLATILLVLWLPTYSYFHDYIEGCRRWFSDIRLLADKKLYKEFKHIVKDFSRI